MTTYKHINGGKAFENSSGYLPCNRNLYWEIVVLKKLRPQSVHLHISQQYYN